MSLDASWMKSRHIATRLMYVARAYARSTALHSFANDTSNETLYSHLGVVVHREGAFVLTHAANALDARELGSRGRVLGSWRCALDDAFTDVTFQESSANENDDELRALASAWRLSLRDDDEHAVVARACATTASGEAHVVRCATSRSGARDYVASMELERVIWLDDGERATSCASSEKEIVFGTDRGRCVFVDWATGVERAACALRRSSNDGAIAHIEFDSETNVVVVRFTSGAVCAASIGNDGKVSRQRWYDAFPSPWTCVAFHRRTRALALGTVDGEIRVYDDAMDGEVGKPSKTFGLRAFGFGTEDTGACAHAKWSNDGRALATGWSRRGIGIWSDAGCLLMCSLQHAYSSGGANAREITEDVEDEDGPRIGACLGVPAWGVGGFSLFAITLGANGPTLLEYSLARNVPNPHISLRTTDGAAVRNDESHTLLAEDRAFILRVNASGKVNLYQAICPATYVEAHWPMRLTAMSSAGTRVAIAGARGCVVYNTRDEKWTMFSSLAEEHEFEALALAWIDVPTAKAHTPILAVAAKFGKPRMFSKSLKVSYRIQFYVRDRLGGSATLGSLPLPAEPTHISARGSHFVVRFENGELAVYKLDMQGDEGAVHPVRESSGQRRKTSIEGNVSLMTVLPQDGAAPEDDIAPSEVLVLTGERDLVLVDLTENHTPVTITNNVAEFWVSPRVRELKSSTNAPSEDENSSSGCESDYGEDALANPINRGCIFAYGADGMRICYFPRGGAQQILRDGISCMEIDRSSKNPELEFDRELYPVKVSLRLSRIIGVAQKLSASEHGASAYFNLAPKSHTIFPCVLRKILSADGHDAALRFVRAARRETPHLTHALEWLLFTALESACLKSTSREIATQSGLTKALALLSELPNYLDIVVSVARKTDNTRWEALFNVAGKPSDLCRQALESGRLRIAACYMLVIDKLEGEIVGQSVAVEVMNAALASRDYRLVEDLIKFLLKPVETKPPSTKEVKPSLLGRVLNVVVPPPNSVLSLGVRGDRELILDAPEQAILKSHLDALARDKDIVSMGAFITETSFDGVGYFKHESSRGGSAYIDNFSTALETAARSLRKHAAARNSNKSPHAERRRKSEFEDEILALDAMDLVNSPSDTSRATDLLEVVRRADCTDWSLLLATVLGRVDALETMFTMERDLLKPWTEICRKCATSSTDLELKKFLVKVVAAVERVFEVEKNGAR